jgi:hypothetical protein
MAFELNLHVKIGAILLAASGVGLHPTITARHDSPPE